LKAATAIAATGFVPDANLVGRAFMIWASTGRPERLGSKIE
jgi:hypothetical protein